jgi:hypothetical protein
MRYWRVTLSGLGVAALCAACAPKPEQQAAAPPPGPARGTPEWKIQNAMSAAPADIGRGAAIMDFPATPTGQPTQLRAGTNGWTCFPDMAESPSNDPTCFDAQWMNWVAAWMGHTTPHVSAVGMAYMLQGSGDASATDPFKTHPDSGQAWVVEGPHVMLIVPQAAMLSGVQDHQGNGQPWVMFKGTPYAHIMMPTAAN